LPCPQDAAATANQQRSSSEGKFKQDTDTTDEWDARFVVKNGNRRAVDQR
jgi:hypothetical protein